MISIVALPQSEQSGIRWVFVAHNEALHRWTLEEREVEMIEAALAETHGRISDLAELPRNSEYPPDIGIEAASGH